jgi:hypothetical protein
MKIRNLILILSLILLGCKDELLLDSNAYEPLMVVDGLITNEKGPYMVEITKSSSVNKLEKIPIENCIVTLLENTGATEILTEIEPGKYVTSENGIKGIIGNEYSLSIISPEGKEYHSDFQKLKELVEIESVYSEIDSIVDVDYSFGLPGYQFYINTEKAETQENYFLWSMTESFEYDIDYKLEYIETRDGVSYNNPMYDTIETCWKTQKVNYIFTGNTSKLSTPQIMKQPLHFVGTNSKNLTKKYSVLVQQYTVDEKAYDYWQGIEEQSSNENFFVSTQPYTIKGNIENINDEKEIILGYFTVASVSQKRIFVERPGKPFYYNKSLVITDREAISDFKRKYPRPYFWVNIGNENFGLIVKDCLDCRTEGGSLFKPEFWINK